MVWSGLNAVTGAPFPPTIWNRNEVGASAGSEDTAGTNRKPDASAVRPSPTGRSSIPAIPACPAIVGDIIVGAVMVWCIVGVVVEPPPQAVTVSPTATVTPAATSTERARAWTWAGERSTVNIEISDLPGRHATLACGWTDTSADPSPRSSQRCPVTSGTRTTSPADTNPPAAGHGTHDPHDRHWRSTARRATPTRPRRHRAEGPATRPALAAEVTTRTTRHAHRHRL